MAFARKAIKAMGLTEEQVDSIMELHTEVVDGLKAERDKYKADADKLEAVKKELDELKGRSGDDYKSKYEKEHADFEAFKKDVAEKETKTAKDAAARAYFESKGITGTNLDIALRGAKDEISAIELDGGKIKDAKALDDLVKGTFAGLVVTQNTKGAQTANPPASNAGLSVKTREDIYKRDEHGRYILDASQRQQALSNLIAVEQQKG